MFNNIGLKRVTELKFQGVMIVQNLNWESHIKLIESKISNIIGVLFKVSLHLNKKYLSIIYFTFIHSYINYRNIPWVSTSQTKF